MDSRIPEVIETLVQLGKTDPELVDVTVADGPEVSDTAAEDWLVVGFDGDPTGDFEAAQSVAEYVGLGTRREEQFQITVAAISNRGDTDIVAARKRAYEIGGRVVAWLHASPSLGLAELEASVGATRLVQDQTDQGASARLLLTVAGRGFI
ncbi:hypothetical protein ACFYQA_17305 [Streptomyces sp. NPDC005774]|uniref:hypothetical protein n=1 Tax=Streptomyces sp. NPDC005774 TaxID=3364728 RepID=UPI0036AAC5EA